MPMGHGKVEAPDFKYEEPTPPPDDRPGCLGALLNLLFGGDDSGEEESNG